MVIFMLRLIMRKHSLNEMLVFKSVKISKRFIQMKFIEIFMIFLGNVFIVHRYSEYWWFFPSLLFVKVTLERLRSHSAIIFSSSWHFISILLVGILQVMRYIRFGKSVLLVIIWHQSMRSEEGKCLLRATGSIRLKPFLV